MSAYRITFQIEQCEDPETEDFVEIGYGSSTDEDTVEECVHVVNSILQNELWETA